MAWPYDNDGGYQSALATTGLGGYGNTGASNAQNVASLYGATGGSSFGSDVGSSTTSGMQAASGGGMFSGLTDLLGGIFNKQSAFGGTDAKGLTTKGWAPLALGAGQAILGGIQGLQAQKLAQNQFKESKRQFDLNYGAQRQSTNTQLEDRQRARVASNPGAYESVSSYLDKNRIK